MLQVLVQAYPVPGLARSMLASVALRTSIGSRLKCKNPAAPAIRRDAGLSGNWQIGSIWKSGRSS